MSDSFQAKAALDISGREYEIHRLDSLQEKFVARLPYSSRCCSRTRFASRMANRSPATTSRRSPPGDARPGPLEGIPFQPARVLMQDFTGVPAVVDLAAMRDAMDDLAATRRRSIRSFPST